MALLDLGYHTLQNQTVDHLEENGIGSIENPLERLPKTHTLTH